MNFIMSYLEFAMRRDKDIFEKMIDRYSYKTIERIVALKYL